MGCRVLNTDSGKPRTPPAAGAQNDGRYQVLAGSRLRPYIASSGRMSP